MNFNEELQEIFDGIRSEMEDKPRILTIHAWFKDYGADEDEMETEDLEWIEQQDGFWKRACNPTGKAMTLAEILIDTENRYEGIMVWGYEAYIDGKRIDIEAAKAA